MTVTVEARRPLGLAPAARRPTSWGIAPWACRATQADLAGFVAADLTPYRAARVTTHLECCSLCQTLHEELVAADTGVHAR